MRALVVALVGAVAVAGTVGCSTVRVAAEAQKVTGVEEGNNLALIKQIAPTVALKVETTHFNVETTVWEGTLSETRIPEGAMTAGRIGLRSFVERMENAIATCSDDALVSAKADALRYLQTVAQQSLGPAIALAQWVRNVRMRCGNRVYAADRSSVREAFAFFVPHIELERRKQAARERRQQQSVAPVDSRIPTPSPIPAVPPATTEDRRTGFRVPSSSGAFRPVSFQASGGVVRRDANATISRLAREVGTTKIHDVSNVKQNDTGGTGEFRVRIPVAATPSNALSCRFADELASRGMGSGCGGMFDVGYRFTGVDGSSAGAGPQLPNLSFPGLGVEGTAGINSNPGGYFLTNRPHTYDYAYQYRQHVMDMVFTRFIDAWLGSNTAIQPIAGVRGTFTQVNDRYSANVVFPGNFTVDGRYTTNTDVVGGGLFVGANVFYSPSGTPVMFFLGGRAGFDVNRAESDIAFTLSSPVVNDLQRTTVTETNATPYLRLEGGVGANILGASVQTSAFVEHAGAFPNVQIPGGGPPPRIEFTTETSYGGRVAVTWNFAPGAR